MMGFITCLCDSVQDSDECHNVGICAWQLSFDLVNHVRKFETVIHSGVALFNQGQQFFCQEGAIGIVGTLWGEGDEIAVDLTPCKEYVAHFLPAVCTFPGRTVCTPRRRSYSE